MQPANSLDRLRKYRIRLRIWRILVRTVPERFLRDLDISSLVANRNFFPSPTHWEDQVVYFLMLDRFSDGKELAFLDNEGNPVSSGTTDPCKPSDNGNAVQTDSDAAGWRDAGTKFVGEIWQVWNPSWVI